MGARRVVLPVLLAGLMLASALAAPPTVLGGSEVILSKGATVYVPIYSNVFTGPKQIPFQLASTLVVRNTDSRYPLTVMTVDYYDTDGKMLRSFIEKPVEVGPLATIYYYIREADKSGGSGANFIVRWEAGTAMNRPIIEGVMVGSQSGRGISYRSPGQEIDTHDR